MEADHSFREYVDLLDFRLLNKMLFCVDDTYMYFLRKSAYC